MSKNVYYLREKALLQGEELSRVRGELRETLLQLKRTCRHPKEHIIKSPFKRGTFGDQQELWLCTQCGTQDEGWNPDLVRHVSVSERSQLKVVSRDQLFEVRDSINKGIHISELEIIGYPV